MIGSAHERLPLTLFNYVGALIGVLLGLTSRLAASFSVS